MRYFIKLAYNGTRFHGWQSQPNAVTVQEEIEAKMSLILRSKIAIVGCGRTDAGVHAKEYFAHFDFEQDLPRNFQYRVNSILSKDIVIKDIFEVPADKHARFDAYHRSYEYHISLTKNPFELETVWQYPYRRDLIDFDKMQAAASVLMQFQDFNTFCKSNTDVKTTLCEMKRSEWIYDAENDRLIYHISANRFLRGMVRLIVGMCLNVATGRVTVQQLRQALEHKIPLKLNHSAPAEGLFLMDIRYKDD
jgi:tRNA pseudouridine38-40 synthase